jgi:hypothetical protein
MERLAVEAGLTSVAVSGHPQEVVALVPPPMTGRENLPARYPYAADLAPRFFIDGSVGRCCNRILRRETPAHRS